MRLLRPRSRVPIGLLPTTNKFDEATGQVYTETIVAIQRSDDRNWVHWLYRQCVFRLQPTASGDQIDEISQGDSTQVGGRSLKETAILCILRNIVDLKLEMIEDLPITVKYQLWDAIKKRNAVSLDTWKIFSQALRHHRSEPDLFDFSCAIKQPKSLLQVYTGPLNSKRCQFVTSLSISMDVSISDLAKLPELSNIIVLEIVCPDASQNQFSVGDRLVRDWHSAVLNDGAFPVLRFLRFWGFEEVTDRSLSYIGAFPALAVFDVGRCSITHESPTPSGWTQIRGDNPSRFLANACSERNRHLYNQKTGAHAYKQGIEILSYESAELESHQPTPRAMPNQSDNQSGMRFIPRGDMPSFMNQPAPAAWLRKEGIYESGMKVDTWGKTTYKLSPLVGDIRHDADLARAGYNIQDQAVIGNALINSVPLISIRLGSKYTISSTCSRISYIRTQVLYPLNIRTPPAHGHNGVKDDTGSTGFSSANVVSHERGLMGSRKRKLNDLLDSFI